MKKSARLLLAVLLTVGSVTGAVAGPRIDPRLPVEPNRLYVQLTPLLEVGPNAIATFEVGPDGEPRLLATQDTGGLGRGFTSRQGVVIHPLRSLLFAANNESGEVSVFRIAGDGSLRPVAGSPFGVGPIPNVLGLDPFRDQLYVSEGFRLGVYDIADDGRLVERQMLRDGALVEPEPHPSGRYLYVADFFRGVRAYEISGTGDWTELPGSPFGFPNSSRTLYLEIDSVGRRLYLQDLDRGIAVFDIDRTGGLTLVPGSPFSAGDFANTLELTFDDRFLYVARPFDQEMPGFETTPQGPLETIPGAPFPVDFATATLLNPFGTTRLYQITRETRRIRVYDIDPAGALSPTAYPPLDVADPAERVPAGAAFWVVLTNVVRP